MFFLCFRFDALNELGAFMRTEFLSISLLRVASGPRVASCKSALNPPVVYSTDRSKAVVPMLVLLFVALWFILRGDLFYVLPCVILLLCFSVLLALRLLRLGKRELILVLFVRLFDLRLFGFISSSSWCLGRAAVCDCGTPCTFLLPFFIMNAQIYKMFLILSNVLLDVCCTFSLNIYDIVSEMYLSFYCVKQTMLWSTKHDNTKKGFNTEKEKVDSDNNL